MGVQWQLSLGRGYLCYYTSLNPGRRLLKRVKHEMAAAFIVALSKEPSRLGGLDSLEIYK